MNIDFPGAIAAWANPDNYDDRPPGAKITGCVLHATAGDPATVGDPNSNQVQATISWFQSDFSAKPEQAVSCHYLIGVDGRVWQCVPEAKRAWHAGLPLPSHNPNDDYVGIELAMAKGRSDYTNAQLGALINLLSWLVQRYGIVRKNIVTHASLNPDKSDPLGWAAYNDKVLNAVFDKSAPHKPAETPPTPDQIRKAAFDAAKIPFNPMAAFVLYARLHGLGGPLSGEFSFTYANSITQYSGQAFAGGIAVCITGDWANIRTETW